MTDVPSKHVWKIKESRIVFKDFDIIAVVSTFWILRNVFICLLFLNLLDLLFVKQKRFSGIVSANQGTIQLRLFFLGNLFSSGRMCEYI